jgi:hypothetical protein
MQQKGKRMRFADLVDTEGQMTVFRVADGAAVKLWPIDARQMLEQGVVRLPGDLKKEDIQFGNADLTDLIAKSPEEILELLQKVEKDGLLAYARALGLESVSPRQREATIIKVIMERLTETQKPPIKENDSSH